MAQNVKTKEDRDELLEEIKQDLETVINDINSFEKIRLLGALGSSLSENVQHTRPALPNIIETSIEYALSIALSSMNDSGLPMPSAEDMIGILGKLEKVREKYINYALTESNPQIYTALEQSLRASVIEKALTVRGEAYRIHIEEIFLELYEEHISFFMENYGFYPEAILETIDYIEYGIKENQLIVKEEHKEFIKWFEAQDVQRLARTYGSGDPFLPSKAYQLETGKSPRFKAIDEQFRFIEGELSNEQKQVIHQLSMQFGENENFLNPKFKALPLNDSLVNSRPILYHDITSSYYCFSTKILHRNLFNIAEGLIKNADNAYFNDTYLGKGKKARSTYFENKVAQLINKMIPNQTIQMNLKYKIFSAEYEIDVLVETQNHIYLVEVKSGLYSNESKRGAIKALKTDLSNLIGYATTQVTRTEDYIKKPEHLFYYKNGATLTVDGNKPIVKIAVSFDSITGVTNQLYNLTQLGIFQQENSFPLSLSIFNLMVIAEIFENDENGFLKYLEARLPLYKEEKFIINNEMDFLGLYLSRDFNKTIKSFKRGNIIIVSTEYRKRLDNYFMSLYEGKKTKKPQKLV